MSIALDKHGMPVLSYPKLKPCPNCGTEVRAQYRAGLDVSIRVMLSDIFADSKPVWFICCEKCLNNLRVRMRRGTWEEKQKALNKLCKEWNKGWTAESTIERLVFVKMEAQNEKTDNQPMED